MHTIITKKKPTKKEKEEAENMLESALKRILQKPPKPLKSPVKMPSVKEQRKRWKLVNGVMVEMGSDYDD